MEVAPFSGPLKMQREQGAVGSEGIRAFKLIEWVPILARKESIENTCSHHLFRLSLFGETRFKTILLLPL